MPYIPRPPRYKLIVRRGLSGLGMFALEDIPKRKFLIEYWGKLVSDQAAQKIGGRYLFELENGKTIAGATKKNLARYINHACKPNAEVIIRGNKVYLYSLKRIKAGDEITYDYGTEYFDYYIKRHGCRCVACVKAQSMKTNHRVYTIPFATVYPLYIAKAEKKGRTKAEVEQIIRWLTGYTPKGLESQIKKLTDLQTFFAKAPKLNSRRKLITGVICGVRVEDIKDKTMREIRYLDKLIDELAKGKAMEKILRTK